MLIEAWLRGTKRDPVAPGTLVLLEAPPPMPDVVVRTSHKYVLVAGILRVHRRDGGRLEVVVEALPWPPLARTCPGPGPQPEAIISPQHVHAGGVAVPGDDCWSFLETYFRTTERHPTAIAAFVDPELLPDLFVRTPHKHVLVIGSHGADRRDRRDLTVLVDHPR